MALITVVGGAIALTKIGALVVAALTIGSMVYQKQQAAKMRKKAKDAADARKGYELVVEGESTPLPVVYGRGLLGGARVYHSVSSSFRYVPSNADKTFQTGPPAIPGTTISGGFKRDSEGNFIYVKDQYGEDTSEREMEPDIELPELPSGLLNKDIIGSKNEFLYFQQAICQGPINAVYDVILDGSRYLNDPSLGTFSGTARKPNNINSFLRPPTNAQMQADGRKAKAAMRIECHYNGGIADSIIAANDDSRVTAKFTNVAYASAVVRLDRDDPQFSGTPVLQFLIEGRLVRTAVNGILSSERVYSNNPAWCLLDYLTDSTYGRGLNISSLDLKSFSDAALVCDKTVMWSAAVGGKIFQPIDLSRDISERAIPLYECNIIVDPLKPIRENVEAILETMGGARLVWSQGRYKLLLQYPGINNADIKVAGKITDDDLALGEDIDIVWPDLDARYNHCIVRYHNESEDFKEDSASWPPKYSGLSVKGLGGRKYPISTGYGTKAHEQFMNTYGVWDGQDETAVMTWKIVPRISGLYTLQHVIDDTGTVTIGATTFQSGWGSIKTHTITLVANQIVTIVINATNHKNLKGAGARLTAPDGLMTWSTRSDAYTNIITKNVTTEVYNLLLAEDHGMELEHDVFLEGITDYYHALAKAEELVRTSRSAFTAKFKHIIKDKYYEPGDFIEFESETAKLGLTSKLYLRVDESNLNDNGLCEITATRFDWTQLAWNVDDDEYLKPGSAYDFELEAPAWLEYSPEPDLLFGSIGKLTWAEVSDSRVVGYILYVHDLGTLNEDGYLNFVEIGRSTNSPFQLPYLTVVNAIFGVRAATASGHLSRMTLSDSIGIDRAMPPQVIDLSATVVGDYKETVQLDWTIPELRLDESEYNDHQRTLVYVSATEDYESSSLLGESSSTTFSYAPTTYGTLYYWVRLLSIKGALGPFSNTTEALVDFWDQGIDTEFDPPAPYALTATALYSGIMLEWMNPYYEEGGGHGATLIYGAEWPEDAPMPGIGSATILARVVGGDQSWVHSVAHATRWVYYAREQSKSSAISSGYAGPADAKTAYDVEALIRAVEGQIKADSLELGLQDRINLIDGPATLPGSVSDKIKTSRDEVNVLLGSQSAAIVSTQEVVGSLAIDMTSLGSRVGSAESSITTLNSTVSNQASTLTQLNSTVGNHSTSLQIYGTSINGLSAQYSVKIDNGGKVVGYGLSSSNTGPSGVTSHFTIAADRFSIGAPYSSNGGVDSNNNYPFAHYTTPQTINGMYVPAGTYLKRAFIFDGEITNAKIGNLAVDEGKIANLSVDTLKIKGNAVTTMHYGYSGGGTIGAGVHGVYVCGAAISMPSGNSGVIITATLNVGTLSNAVSVNARIIRSPHSGQYTIMNNGQQVEGVGGMRAMQTANGNAQNMSISVFDPNPAIGSNSYILVVDNMAGQQAGGSGSFNLYACAITAIGGKR